MKDSPTAVTTGIKDVEWLDAAVCELSDKNAKLKSALEKAEAEMRYADWGIFDHENIARKTAYDEVVKALSL